jgi:hypothetical protein
MSPYVFGLSDDRSFDETYQEWQRSTDALEHILLSYLQPVFGAVSRD